MLSSPARDTSCSKFTSRVGGSRFAATVISSGLVSTLSKFTPTLVVVNLAATLSTPGPTMISTRGGFLRQCHKTWRTLSCLSTSDVSSVEGACPSVADVDMIVLEDVEWMLLVMRLGPEEAVSVVVIFRDKHKLLRGGRCRDHTVGRESRKIGRSD